MAKSEWRVTGNMINGEKYYALYRLKDKDAVDHSGNREVGPYIKDKEHLKRIAEFLNRMEGQV